MKFASKGKVFFVIILTSLLVAVLLLRRQKFEKTSNYDEPVSSNQQLNEEGDNIDAANNRNSKVELMEAVKETSSQISSSSEKPKKEAAEDRFSDLELPYPPFEKGETEVALAKLKADQLWKMQDKVMDKWPDYSDIQEQLQEGLFAEINPNTLSDDEIVQIASELRERFWHAGGGLSRTSYVNAYKARVLLELAHNRNPQNMLITDELVESIQTVHPIFKFDFKENRFLKDDNVTKVILDLRAKQYEQLRDEIVQGRKPTIADFLRSVDLAFLYQGMSDISSSKKIVQWLRSNANLGGWAEHNEDLSGWEEALDLGKKYGFNIYVPTQIKNHEDELRYGRRLPSFLGPKKRGAILRVDGTPGFKFRKEIVTNHVNN